MGWLNVLAVAVGLAMDALAVAIAAGLQIRPLTFRHVFRLSWHFGLFQFMMPVVGWFAGRRVDVYVAAYDHWIAFALLAFIGGKMLWESFSRHDGRPRSDPTRGLSLVTLSLATSIDALAVGLSMAFLGISVWGPSVVIGLTALAFTCVGITLGGRLGRLRGRQSPGVATGGPGRWLPRVADAAGGIVLIGIGLRILLSHALA